MNVKVLILSLIVLFFSTPLFVKAQETTEQEIASEYYSNKEYSKTNTYTHTTHHREHPQNGELRVIELYIRHHRYSRNRHLLKAQE